MSKLTLSVSPPVVREAKRYAGRHGTSVSHLVEEYLTLLVRPPQEADRPPPVLMQLRGILRAGGREAYRKHLRKKYR